MFAIRNRLRRWLFILQNATAPICRRPIFILGNQKSGTSVVAALLARLTELPVTIDLLREIKDPSFHRVLAGALPLTRFVRRNGRDFSRPIIKEPNLTFLFSELYRRFPAARFVFVSRDPRDNIRSVLNRLHLPGNQTDLTPAQECTVPPAWQLVLRNEGLVCPAGGYVARLAWRWQWTADLYRTHRTGLLLIRYEDFLRDKEAAIGDLAARLALPAIGTITSLLDHPFQPAGNRAANWLGFFGPENLARINAICLPGMLSLGYSPKARGAWSGCPDTHD